MGLLQRLFGTRTPPAAKPMSDGVAPPPAIEVLGPETVHIRSRDFFGQVSRSPNGRYALGWRDADPDGGRGGARDAGLGDYLLLEGERILVEGRMARPNDGKIADDGTFILNDWTFDSLAGVFRAFRPDGTPILARRFQANLLNNSLSADGTLAACQTCNSPHEPDSSRLVLFNLRAGVETACVTPPSGWARDYAFEPAGQVLLGYDDDQVFAYGLDGAFLDEARWTDHRLARGDLYLVDRILRDAGGPPSRDLAHRCLAAVDLGLAGEEATAYPRTRAFGLKLRGICLEALDRAAEAVAAYEQAMAADPKTGVKRRAEQLRKALTAGA